MQASDPTVYFSLVGGVNFSLNFSSLSDEKVHNLCFILSEKDRSLSKLYVYCRSDCTLHDDHFNSEDGKILVEIIPKASSSVLRVSIFIKVFALVFRKCSA